MSERIRAKLTDLASGKRWGNCPDCREHVTVTEDLEGFWAECGCAAGYVQGSKLSVLPA